MINQNDIIATKIIIIIKLNCTIYIYYVRDNLTIYKVIMIKST